MEKATFGAGCFWGVEVEFGQHSRRIETAVGYEGGQTERPSYKDVCTDRTGHAEVVELTFDPAKVSYEQLWRPSSSSTTRPSSTARAPTGARSTAAQSSSTRRSRKRRRSGDRKADGGAEVQEADRHPGRPGADLLEGRRISPEISGEARRSLLPHLIAWEAGLQPTETPGKEAFRSGLRLERWCTRQDSNLRPNASEAFALSI